MRTLSFVAITTVSALSTLACGNANSPSPTKPAETADGGNTTAVPDAVRDSVRSEQRGLKPAADPLPQALQEIIDLLSTKACP